MTEINPYIVWIDKICDSKVLTSASDERLLRYLAESTMNNSILKETVIAVDVFNRDPTFNPGDNSIVRSSIYNLRKKLATYYLNEGKDDLIRISIPKGNYRLDFQEVKLETATRETVSAKKILSVSNLLIAGLLVLSCLFGVLYFMQQSKLHKLQSAKQGNYFWGDFIRSEKPLLIVLGDYFMMEKTPSADSSRNFIRNPFVNNPDEFLAYRESNPEMRSQLNAFGMSYFGEEIPWCMLRIAEVFNGTTKKIELKYASALLATDMRDKDIIFIGDFSTLGLLKGFLEKTHYQVSLSPPTIKYAEQKNQFIETMSLVNNNESEFQNDYSIVAKIQGSQHSLMMFFLSFSPFGKTEAIYKLTDPEFISELDKITTVRPASWDLLLKVSGLKTSGFYYEILRFEELKP